MESFKAYVDRIIYRNTENGYTILSAEENGCETVCTGVFRFIEPGEYIEFTGDFIFHPSYGEQFKVDHYETIEPEDIVAIERYLSSGAIKGIGQVTAKRIIEKFGEDALRIIDEEPERLAEIKGISRSKAQEIAAQQEEKKDLRRALMFLGNYGISNAMAVKIYDQYQNAVYDIIRENPYQLADDILGIGFRKADEIAFKAGISPDSDFRIKSCIQYELVQAASDGHVYLPDDLLKRRCLETLRPNTMDDVAEITEEDIERCIMDLAIESRLIIKNAAPEENVVPAPASEAVPCDDEFFAGLNLPGSETIPHKEVSHSSRQIYHSIYYYTELGIAKMMHELDLRGRVPEEKILERIQEIEEKSGIVLDELQRKAVMEAANSGILIITGGPGTGKTTTINSIIKYFEQDYKEILLAAPTGRAAKRMTEATGWEAKTIHRMLDLSGELEDTSAGARFDRNEDNPLEADVVIIDEMSMVDMFLMSSLLRAIEPGTRLILVGDVDQLPSVGPGNVLRDLIDSGCYKTVKLTRIFRQAEESDIVVNAHKINRGEQISLRPDSKDFIFIKREDTQSVLSAVLGLVRDKLPGYVGTDRSEIQVLAPVKRGPLGVEFINKFLQESLNPQAKGKSEIPAFSYVFREGDKVMHIKNNYNLDWEMRTKSGFAYDQGKGIFNGDLGVITKINEHSKMLEVRFDDGKYVIYNFDQLEELTLAYAATIHKSQGSEYPAVVLPLLSGPPLLMNRNILYTAVTRAKKCVCIVGSESIVKRMIENIREQKRYSGLKDRILEFRNRVL
ncbi:MAG: ATP-dependent RecD-like DNA helicase [Parasporobacterium sp.]|nr:ATP-dependent RecD-like DNA helicase [Parasporobacterium sp.]